MQMLLELALIRVDSHKDFKEKYNLPFMLLSDPDGETAKKYGALNNFFIFKLAKRQSFIIDPEGTIRDCHQIMHKKLKKT